MSEIEKVQTQGAAAKPDDSQPEIQKDSWLKKYMPSWWVFQPKPEKVNIDIHRQKMGMVFQQFNLFPHLTVLDNLTLAPVLLKKMTKAQAKEKAMELLNRIGLADKADVRRSRVRNTDISTFDIHDRVNYSVKKSAFIW